jgi:hypothetical protein
MLSPAVGPADALGDRASIKQVTSSTDWRFNYLPQPALPGFQDKATQDSLFQWGLRDNMYCAKFTFDAHLPEWEVDQFVQDFFACPQVCASLKVLNGSGAWGKMQPTPGALDATEQRVVVQRMAHTVTSLAFFDKIHEHGGWNGGSLLV